MMELLSNNSLSAQMASTTTNTTGNNGGNPNNGATTAERLLAGILDSFPSWDISSGMMANDTGNK